MADDTQNFEELVRVGNPIEADLLAAFLEDGDITFKLIKTAQTMASILPTSQAPIVFQVLTEDMPRAQELLEAYRESQMSTDVSDDEDEDE